VLPGEMNKAVAGSRATTEHVNTSRNFLFGKESPPRRDAESPPAQRTEKSDKVAVRWACRSYSTLRAHRALCTPRAQMPTLVQRNPYDLLAIDWLTELDVSLMTNGGGVCGREGLRFSATRRAAVQPHSAVTTEVPAVVSTSFHPADSPWGPPSNQVFYELAANQTSALLLSLKRWTAESPPRLRRR
jgi:hypothetical protein